MRFFIFFIILILALFFQWLLGYWISPWGVPPPVAILGVLIAFWHLTLAPRLWFSLAAGIVLDGVTLLPFGTYGIILMGAAVSVEILQNLFSNIESKFVEGLSVSLVLALLSIAFLPLGSMLARAGEASYYFRFAELGDIVLASLFWASLTFLFYSGFYIWFRDKKYSLLSWRV